MNKNLESPNTRIWGKGCLFRLVGFILTFVVIIFYFQSTETTYESPFIRLENVVGSFCGDVGGGKYSVMWEQDVDTFFFHPYYDVDENGSAGFQYDNKVYKEEIEFSGAISYTAGLTAPFFDDRIIDYWIQGFKVSQEKEVFSVCYQFRSGAVLQVADLYDIYGKPFNAMHPHKYRVVRMFFVGNRYKERKYRKYFAHAYFDTEANIRHYKELMKEGKGWVQQANRYINEKEVKKEKPILDYRTNPDYYKPLSEPKSGKSWVSRLVE
jgi:hypothetical protein